VGAGAADAGRPRAAAVPAGYHTLVAADGHHGRHAAGRAAHHRARAAAGAPGSSALLRHPAAVGARVAARPCERGQCGMGAGACVVGCLFARAARPARNALLCRVPNARCICPNTQVLAHQPSSQWSHQASPLCFLFGSCHVPSAVVTHVLGCAFHLRLRFLAHMLKRLSGQGRACGASCLGCGSAQTCLEALSPIWAM